MPSYIRHDLGPTRLATWRTDPTRHTPRYVCKSSGRLTNGASVYFVYPESSHLPSDQLPILVSSARSERQVYTRTGRCGVSCPRRARKLHTQNLYVIAKAVRGCQFYRALAVLTTRQVESRRHTPDIASRVKLYVMTDVVGGSWVRADQTLGLGRCLLPTSVRMSATLDHTCDGSEPTDHE